MIRLTFLHMNFPPIKKFICDFPSKFYSKVRSKPSKECYCIFILLPLQKCYNFYSCLQINKQKDKDLQGQKRKACTFIVTSDHCEHPISSLIAHHSSHHSV